MALDEIVRRLYDEYGQKKPMGSSAKDPKYPHYFLHRKFFEDQDLLIIFNTKRCRYQCHFCALPLKNESAHISGEDIQAQFEYAVTELKHSLSVLDRITLSNEGSVLDNATFSRDALLTIASGIRELRRVRTLVLETRLEFVDPQFIQELTAINPRAKVNILTGFESVDSYIRDKVLVKHESIDTFLEGLDKVSESGAHLTGYVLFKPVPDMSDSAAIEEANASIDFLAQQCEVRGIPLSVRLNPMYVAAKSLNWAKLARATPTYLPPRLSDVLALAEKKAAKGIDVYIGLSTEGLEEPWGTYACRDDYSPALLKQAIVWNSRRPTTVSHSLTRESVILR